MSKNLSKEYIYFYLEKTVYYRHHVVIIIETDR